MKKIRTTSWFLLLVIILAIFVSFTMAQETPSAAGGQVFRYHLAEPLSGEPLAHSSEVTQIELSTTNQTALSLPAVSVSLAPSEVDAVSQEPTTPVDSSVIPIPDELQNSMVPGGSSPAEPVAVPFDSEQRIDFTGRYVGLPQPSPSPSAADDTCNQLLVNPKLDVVGTSVAPWITLVPNVYFSDEDYVSPQHSLLFVDNDSGDTSPDFDAFGQTFSVPSNLTKVTIEYNTMSFDSNSADYAGGELYTLDAEGNIDQFLVGWEVHESPSAWQTQTLVLTDKADLQPMEGQDLLIAFFNDTTGSAPGEVVFFDDITFTACQTDGTDSHIIVKKQTDPAGVSQIFTFDPSWSASNFQLSDGQSKTSPALEPGTYSVSELPVSGWIQTSATCDDGSSPGSISLDPGESVTCTFKNVQEIVNPKDAFITIKKETDPAGATQKFTFASSWTSNFQLADGESNTSQALAPGTYSVNELAQSGWKMTSATCDNGSSPNSISLLAGETVTCTFRNTKDAFITVKKETDPAGASQKFTFDSSWTSDFQLADGESKTSSALAPGTYSVKELAQSGWKLDGATCSDGSSPDSISLQAGRTVTCTFKNVKEIADSCRQLLVNTKMDVVEVGDEKGTAEPWLIPFPIVYFTNDPDWAYDGYSMVLVDGDPDDPSPEIDMFTQSFQMPGNLTEIRIEYQRMTLGANSMDEVYGELYLLDDDWTLHWPDDKYGVAGWTVAESEGKWEKQIITSDDQTLLSRMAGKKMAVLLFNITDGGGEDMFFDNIMLTACSKGEPSSGKVFMPTIMHNFGKAAGPICTPPLDPPFDNWEENRGLVQTGATCSSDIKNNDRKDYYTFKPSEDGNHTLWLTDLSPGTNWAASIWVNSAKPDYAPGDSSKGTCIALQKGDGDKQVVCTLNKGTDYFVKIDSGTPAVAGSYKMKVTAP